MSKGQLAKYEHKMLEALQIIDSEIADDIIGEPGPEHGVLIQGAEATQLVLWAMMKGHGLKQTGTTLDTFAKSSAIIYTLVHYAYALGIKRGRQAVTQGTAP